MTLYSRFELRFRRACKVALNLHLLVSKFDCFSMSDRKMASARFLRACLLTCLVISRIVGYYNIPQAPNREMLFAPRVLIEGSCSRFAVCLWRRSSHLRPDLHHRSQWSRESAIPSCYWLLLLEGDVELNPGPVRFPCTICKKPVKKNQRGLCCDACNLWSHACCSRVSKKEYEKLSADCESDWFCPVCVLANLPFADQSLYSSPLAPEAHSNHADPSISLSPPTGESPTSSSTSTASSSSLRCLLLNARSIANKSEALRALLDTDHLDLVAITETFLDEDILDSELVNTSFTVYRRDRNRHGGGVMVLVKSSIPSRRRTDLEVENCELVWIEIPVKTKKILIGVFYRSPNTSIDHLTQLQDSLQCIHDRDSYILCGDFNTPEIAWKTMSPARPSPHTKLVCDIAQQFSLQQLVQEPTRGSNILDLVLTNDTEIVQNVTVTEGIQGSDHDGVCFEVTPRPTPAPQPKARQIYNYRKADFDLFHRLLQATPWNCCLLENDVNEAWIKFKDTFFIVVDQCIPKLTLGKKKKRNCWLSDDTLHLIRKKKRAYRLARKCPSAKHTQCYKSLCNQVRSLTRRDHREHLEHITSDLHRTQKPF